MDSKKEELIKSKKISTEDLIRTDLAKEPEHKPKRPGFIARKSKRLKKALGEFWILGKSGFLMGGIVGGIMGFLGGCVSAYTTKTLLPIPIAMCASGFFFASLMSIGACLRTEDGEEMIILFTPYSKLKYVNETNSYVLEYSNTKI